MRSGEFIGFGNYKAEVFYFGKEKSPQGFWPLKYNKMGDTLGSITLDFNKQIILFLDCQFPKGFSVGALKTLIN